MSIVIKEEALASIATPPAGKATLFIDTSDDLLKKKNSDGSVDIIEPVAAAVSSVFGRVGAIVAVANDYTAAQVQNTPAGNISAVTVQAALNELDTEKAPITHVGSNGVAQHAVVTGTDAGFMSVADKSKLDGISPGATAGITDLTGDVTATGPGSVAVTLLSTVINSKLLTGFSAAPGVVSALDSILQGIQKLAATSTMTLNTVSSNTTVPSGYTWFRQNKTIFSGTTKITIESGAKLSFIG